MSASSNAVVGALLGKASFERQPFWYPGLPTVPEALWPQLVAEVQFDLNARVGGTLKSVAANVLLRADDSLVLSIEVPALGEWATRRVCLDEAPRIHRCAAISLGLSPDQLDWRIRECIQPQAPASMRSASLRSAVYGAARRGRGSVVFDFRQPAKQLPEALLGGVLTHFPAGMESTPVRPGINGLPTISSKFHIPSMADLFTAGAAAYQELDKLLEFIAIRGHVLHLGKVNEHDDPPDWKVCLVALHRRGRLLAQGYSAPPLTAALIRKR